MSPLTKKQKAAMRKKVGTAAAGVARKHLRRKTPAELRKDHATDSRKRVKALVHGLTPAKRKKVIGQLKARKAARAKK
jgi:hypothetical protein